MDQPDRQRAIALDLGGFDTILAVNDRGNRVVDLSERVLVAGMARLASTGAFSH